jgi:hypothetical protein
MSLRQSARVANMDLGANQISGYVKTDELWDSALEEMKCFAMGKKAGGPCRDHLHQLMN